MAAQTFEVGSPDDKGKRATVVMAFVVLGPAHVKSAGRIKPVPLAANINSPLVDYKDDVARISTSEEKKARGVGVACSEFLEDMFHAEGKDKVWEAYRAHQQAIFDGRTKTPFPADLLPAKLRAWSETAETKASQFDPREFIGEAEHVTKATPKAPPKSEAKHEPKA
jgi:hypothetical protein